MLSWTFNGFRFYNTFWASCQDHDNDCEKYVNDQMSNLDKVAEVRIHFRSSSVMKGEKSDVNLIWMNGCAIQDLRQSVKKQTNCNPKFNCYRVEEADDKCFKK